MQVIRQDHGGFDGEGMPRAHAAERDSQERDMLGQQPKPPVGKVDRKEVAAAREEVSPKVGRCLILAAWMMRWVSRRSTHPTHCLPLEFQ